MPSSFSESTPTARFRGTLFCAAFATLASCASQGVDWAPTWESPYGSFDEAEREALSAARTALDTNRPQRAWELLRPAVAADRTNLELAAWLQEAELELVAAGEAPAVYLSASSLAAHPERELRRLYFARAQLKPSAAAYVLAARLEDDVIAARAQLEIALELDPECAWAYYGLAHVALSDSQDKSRWSHAQERLAEALELDPNHFRARRLEAWMLAQEGASDAAVQALEHWLVHALGDPRVAPSDRVGVQLDLASLHIALGRPAIARRLVESLNGSSIERGRRYALLACIEEAQGNPQLALDFARRAEVAMGGSALPLVQQAMLFGQWLGRPTEAVDAWERVVERVAESPDPANLLQLLRARVLLERDEFGEESPVEGEERTSNEPTAGATP